MIFQTGQGPYSIITMKNTKGKLETDSDMEVESITIVMHQSIKVNLGITWEMEKAQWSMVIIISMKGYGRMMWFRDMEYTITLTLHIMKECLGMEKEMDKGRSITINRNMLKVFG